MKMITIYADNTLSLNHRHIGSVKQEETETAVYVGGKRYGLGKRITLSKPDKAGWVELEAAMRDLGLLSA